MQLEYTVFTLSSFTVSWNVWLVKIVHLKAIVITSTPALRVVPAVFSPEELIVLDSRPYAFDRAVLSLRLEWLSVNVAYFLGIELVFIWRSHSLMINARLTGNRALHLYNRLVVSGSRPSEPVGTIDLSKLIEICAFRSLATLSSLHLLLRLWTDDFQVSDWAFPGDVWVFKAHSVGWIGWITKERVVEVTALILSKL